MTHEPFSVGEVVLDPFHIGPYGQGAFIVTGVTNKSRFGKETQLLDVIYLDAEPDENSFNNNATRGINCTNKGKVWGNSVDVRFNSTVSVDAKRISATCYSHDHVKFEVSEYNQ